MKWPAFAAQLSGAQLALIGTSQAAGLTATAIADIGA